MALRRATALSRRRTIEKDLQQKEKTTCK